MLPSRWIQPACKNIDDSTDSHGRLPASEMSWHCTLPASVATA